MLSFDEVKQRIADYHEWIEDWKRARFVLQNNVDELNKDIADLEQYVVSMEREYWFSRRRRNAKTKPTTKASPKKAKR